MALARDPLGWRGSTLESKYRIDELVGEGGFGFVYRGTHLRLGKPIAVKFLRPDLVRDPAKRRSFLKRFLAEGQFLHDLSRATLGVVQAHDLGAEVSPRGEWTPFIVMEWIEGHTLSEELRRRPKRSVAEALALLAPALDALAVAHEMGIVHRDLKPANLMLCTIGGRASLKILDFGIAKAIGFSPETVLEGADRKETRAFSVAYGAPEQFDPSLGATGPWTDVYAFGLLLVEMVNGTRAYASDDYVKAGKEALDLEKRPALRDDRSLDDVLRRVLAVDPRNRPRSAGELRALLTNRSSRQPSLETEPPGETLVPTKTRRRSNLWLLLLGFVLLGGLSAAAWFGFVRTPPSNGAAPLPDVGLGVPDVASPEQRALTILKAWNDAEAGRRGDELVAMYAPMVCVFGDLKTGRRRADELVDYYRRHATFTQEVKSPTITRLSPDVRLDFEKSYLSDSGVAWTHGYLVLDDAGRIRIESDQRLDRGTGCGSEEVRAHGDH